MTIFQNKKSNDFKRGVQMTKKLGLLSVMSVLTVLLVTAQAFAVPYPWLDFMGTFTSSAPGVFDADYTTDTKTDAAITIRYNDGSAAGLGEPMVSPFFQPIFLGADMTIDLNQATGAILIEGMGGGIFTADLIFDPSFDYTASTGTTALLLGSIYVGPASQWYDEFSVASLSSPYDGQLILNLNGSTTVKGVTTYNISGKLAPVPEPGTIILLGSGLVGLALYGRRRKKS